MAKNKLAYRVKRILSENSDYLLTLKEIAELIRIKKHEFAILKKTVIDLVKEGKIERVGKKFRSAKRPRKKVFESDKIVTGIFDASPLSRNMSFAFVLCDDFDVFIFAEDTLNAYHNDEVEVEIKYKKGTRYYGIVKKIIKRTNSIIVGTVQQYRNSFYLIPNSSKFHNKFLITEKNDAKPNQKVVLEVVNWGNLDLRTPPAGKVIEILGDSDDPKVEVMGIIRQYGLPLEFDPDIIKEANEISAKITEEEISRRKDFRNLLTFTIDPVSAKDYDDAISLEKTHFGFRLYVHIADVSYYVKEGSKLFIEASKRANSFYFPKMVIPMLPEKISNGVCSLRPFEDKLTLTVITDFSNELHIIKQSIEESIINSNARLTYEEVDELFDKKTNNLDSEISKTLLQMREISYKLSAERNKKGYINFNLPETKFIYDEEGELIGFTRDKETDSHKMIENFMLLANEYVAKLLSNITKTTMYRIHEKPDVEDLEKTFSILRANGFKVGFKENLNKTVQNVMKLMKTEEQHIVFDKMLLRNMKKAKYHTENLEHFGLAMKYYTHFTSPIRRLCDLLVHTQLKRYKFHSSKTEFSLSQMKHFAVTASLQEVKADESEREIEFIFKKRFMKDKLGDEFEAIITGMNKAVMFIELYELPIRGVIRMSEIEDDYFIFNEKSLRMVGKKSGKTYKLTDKINVILTKIEEEMYFSIKE